VAGIVGPVARLLFHPHGGLPPGALHRLLARPCPGGLGQQRDRARVDSFTTLAKIAGGAVPTDRPIDGFDQTDFLLGKSEKSSHEGFPIFVADRLEGVKWRSWKVVVYEEERDCWTPPAKLGEPKIFDLVTDPKEEYPRRKCATHGWRGRP
jgi:hypothetical protein